MRTAHRSRRRAVTLPELLLVLALAGVAMAVGLRPLRHHLDRLATRAAASEAALTLAEARRTALAQHAPVGVLVDTARGTLTLLLRGAPIAVHPLGETHGVSLGATRDSLAYDARGLGFGAANLSLVIRRGAAVETVVVSRLGRIRS